MDCFGLFFKCSVLHHEHFYLAYIGRFAVNTFVHKFINAGMNLSSSSMAESMKNVCAVFACCTCTARSLSSNLSLCTLVIEDRIPCLY